MTRPTRSRRSHVAELVLVGALILAIYLWMTNGGPEAFGRLFAEHLTTS